MEEGGPSQSGEEPKSWDELYNVNLMPSEIFLKFRKEIEGYRVGVNLEVLISHQPSISLVFNQEIVFHSQAS